VRNALIVLLAVALVLLGIGAISHSMTFDINYGIGSYRNVSAFWVALVIAVVFFAAGLVAVVLARSSGSAGRRKVETELQSVYQRLREAEAAQKQTAMQLAECELALDEARAEARGPALSGSVDETADFGAGDQPGAG